MNNWFVASGTGDFPIIELGSCEGGTAPLAWFGGNPCDAIAYCSTKASIMQPINDLILQLKGNWQESTSNRTNFRDWDSRASQHLGPNFPINLYVLSLNSGN